MGVFLGLLSALTYGATDFLGGLLSRRTSVLAVVFGSNLVGTILVAPLLAAVEGRLTGEVMAWGVAAGASGGLGVAALFRGLAVGRMSAVAPVTAVVTAAVPLLAGIALGERPGAGSLVGVVVALAGVVLIASGEGRSGEEPIARAADELVPEGGSGGSGPVAVRASASVRARALLPAGVPEALAAGLLFGTYLVLLDRAPDDSGLWPVIAARLASLTTVAALAALARRSLVPAPGTRWGVASVGLLDALGNVAFLAAVRLGLLSLVGAVSALYPVGTVLLARVVLGERMSGPQAAGLGLIALGIGLIAGT